MLLPLCVGAASCSSPTAEKKPNVIMIYVDDLGYGDLGCYGADHIQTPNLDALAASGIRFTDCHSPSATSTPSRYSLMTGRYAWRVPGTDVIPGDAALLIDTSEITLPKVFQSAGYNTAAIGKWHLGLGLKKAGQDWNGHVAPGPNEVGFDYSFIIPATGDRVPCVYVENGRVVNLDPSDPIVVDYSKPVPGELVAKEHPELLKQMWSHGHNQALINGIGRIGYMGGGKSALWEDEKIAGTLADKAVSYITGHKDEPFFLYFATHDIHVPRVPAPEFEGKSGLGKRGDVILQLDWTVGQIVECLDSVGLRDDTIVIFSSDNGPVLDDGYADDAVALFEGHSVSGPLRGYKGGSWEGGTRVPAFVSCPGMIAGGQVSDTRLCHIDLLASFASYLGIDLPDGSAPDSMPMMDQWLGKSNVSRPYLVEHNHRGVLSYVEGDWKYIEKAVNKKNQKYNEYYGSMPEDMLFNLKEDLGETVDLAAEYPEKVKEMSSKLQAVKNMKTE